MDYLIIIPIVLCCLYFLWCKASMGEVKGAEADALRDTLDRVKKANDARADAGLLERMSKYRRD
jgi:hypothetical protein